ncbi:AraC family transcriptional regulator [Alkalilimnicola ehrlichii]|uniref:helix-turn-helix transcriptional regulator n=1 Tax=Alkalilimnicola ehrlichii TaxID=351052 RepID=UPI001C6E5650|nr:AraC family transcriptional regulator [Alkalilimnicola ehrlichii]
MTFGLWGQSRYTGADGQQVDFLAGHTTITAFRESRGERRYEGGNPVRQLRLLVSERRLRHYAGADDAHRLLGSGPVTRLHLGKTSGISAAHLRTLTTGVRLGCRPLTLSIHALSILADQLEHLLPKPCASDTLSLDEVEKLERARDLMRGALDQPLTIGYLSSQVGLNASKLKQGFRTLFNTTPGRMLLALRMEKAHALLVSGCQVAQTAYRVGYTHPGNFSVAFSRYFGTSPKTVSRRRSKGTTVQ